MLRETIYVSQASFAYKTLIFTVVLSRRDVSHSNLWRHMGIFNVSGGQKRYAQPLY